MFKGVNSPVITILKDDGSIDYGNMERHINHLIEAAVSVSSMHSVTQRNAR